MKKKIISFLLMLMPLYAGATPVTWQLQDVMIGAGDALTELTGTFVFDADLQQYSNVDITSQDGIGWVCQVPTAVSCAAYETLSFAGDHYDYGGANALAALFALNISGSSGTLIGAHLLYMTFASNLTNAGGSVAISSGIEVVCQHEDCRFDWRVVPVRGVVSQDLYDASHTVLLAKAGRVVSISVPEPSTIALFGIAILAIGSLRQRRFLEKRR